MTSARNRLKRSLSTPSSPTPSNPPDTRHLARKGDPEAWDEARVVAARDAVLWRVGQASKAHPDVSLDGDAQVGELLEAVNVARHRQDLAATLEALRALEAHSLARYQGPVEPSTERRFDVATIVEGLRRNGVTMTTHTDEEGRTWPQLRQEQGRPIPIELTRAVCRDWEAVLAALDGGGSPIE